MHKPTAISYCYGCPLPPLGYASWTVKRHFSRTVSDGVGGGAKTKKITLQESFHCPVSSWEGAQA